MAKSPDSKRALHAWRRAGSLDIMNAFFGSVPFGVNWIIAGFGLGENCQYCGRHP